MEKMHSVIEKDEIDELIRNAAEDTSEWIENDAERKDFFKSALASGDRGKIINVIKTIRLHKTEREESGKRLHQSDEAFLKEAEALIYEEFAVVLGIEPVKVLDYIMDEISKLEKVPSKLCFGGILYYVKCQCTDNKAGASKISVSQAKTSDMTLH